MFAGPNGSGKSTLKSVIPAELLGIYVNADEIEKEIRSGSLLLEDFNVEAEETEIRNFLRQSSLLVKARLTNEADRVQVNEGKLSFTGGTMNSYYAAVLADFIRQYLLEAEVSFTFETVMSFPDKVDFLARARDQGCRTYLYYVATEDPEINVSRVQSRVKAGGHPVPEDKIVSRYWNSLALLPDAIRNSNRAFIFDNSGEGQDKTWVAEITDGKSLEIKSDLVPAWFKRSVLDKFKA